jgi:hypothetical protein
VHRASSYATARAGVNRKWVKAGEAFGTWLPYPAAMSLRYLGSRESVALLAVLGVTACGSSGEDDNDRSASGALTDGDFRAQYPALACASLETCCSAAGFDYNPSLCQAFLTPVPTPNAVFDPVAAADCLETLRAGPVDCGNSEPAIECEGVYVGTVAQGGACSDDAECAAPENGTATCNSGQCVTAIHGVEGQKCSSSCAPFGGSGQICSGAGLDDAEQVQCWRSDGLVCAEGTCTALGGPGAECAFDDDCRDEAYCEGPACRLRAESGAMCSASVECALGTYCEDSCKPQLPEGEPCATDEQCSSGTCAGTCTFGDPLGGLGTALLGLLCGG